MCTVESHNEIAHSECLKYSEANYTQVHYTVKVTGNIKITIKYYTVQVTNLRGPSDSLKLSYKHWSVDCRE